MLTEAQLATLAYVDSKCEILTYPPSTGSTPLKRLVKLGLVSVQDCGRGLRSWTLTPAGKTHLQAFSVQAHEAMFARGWG